MKWTFVTYLYWKTVCEWRSCFRHRSTCHVECMLGALDPVTNKKSQKWGILGLIRTWNACQTMYEEWVMWRLQTYSFHSCVYRCDHSGIFLHPAPPLSLLASRRPLDLRWSDLFDPKSIKLDLMALRSSELESGSRNLIKPMASTVKVWSWILPTYIPVIPSLVYRGQDFMFKRFLVQWRNEHT